MLKILELFAGYGSQALALENLGLEFTSDISEVDKYAIEAYNQINGQTKNYGDICKIKEDELPDYDLITYSSPCQDFSIAGKMKGGQKGSGTRSSLLWECERIIRSVKPKYLLMENVKNLVGKKFKPCFVAWLQTLEELGYKNYWQVLNAKDYGVPQNRERVFVVSIRKDLNQTYMFPEPMPLTLKLKDLLETEVDERYYLPQEKVEKLILNLNKDISNTVRTKFERYPPTTGVLEIGVKREVLYKITKEGNIRGFQNDEKKSGASESQFYNPNNVCGALTTQGVAGLIEIGNIFDTEYFGGNPQAGRVYSAEGLSPCLNTMGGGNIQPKVLEEGIGHNPISKKFEFDGFHDQPAPTLLATDYKAPKCYSDGIRIRKLTPREYWRLMGVKDEQYDRLNGIRNTQLYKMAGNSIVVNVLMAIFKNLLISDKETKGQLSLL